VSSPETSRRVLVTGSAGAVGRLICPALRQRGHFIRGLDVQAGEAADENLIADVRDPDALQCAAAGMDTLIHLATAVGGRHFADDLVPTNVTGTFHVLEAARQAGLRRAILTSSVEVTWPPPAPKARSTPVGPAAGARALGAGFAPRNLYAVTKICLEEMGKLYAAKTDMRVLVVRLGWCPTRAVFIKYNWEKPRNQGVYLSHRDAQRFFVRAVEAELPCFAVVYAVSGAPHGVGVDPAPAAELLGFEPQDRYPNGCVLFPRPQIGPNDPDVLRARGFRGQRSDRFP